MSRHETITLACDLDGETSGVQMVCLALNGREYEIDLCPGCHMELAERTQPYVIAARPQRALSHPGHRTAADRREAGAIRAWALAHAGQYGWEIGERGRIPTGVKDIYRAIKGGTP